MSSGHSAAGPWGWTQAGDNDPDAPAYDLRDLATDASELLVAPGSPGAAPRDASAGRVIVALALATAAIGMCLGGLGLVIVAFSQTRHDPAAVAWIEAVLSAGSALGGLAYGAVTWRIPAQHRLALLAADLAVIVIPVALSPDLPVLALLTGLAGILASPALSTAYVITAAQNGPFCTQQAIHPA